MNKQSEVMVRCQEKKKKTENKRRVFPPLKWIQKPFDPEATALND
jgi:hypothetical protein